MGPLCQPAQGHGPQRPHHGRHAAPGRGSGSGGGRKNPTSTAPPGLSEAQEARARADAVIAAAAAAGAPLRDPLGRPVSPVTLREYGQGRKPANAGRRFPAEVLAQARAARELGIGATTVALHYRSLERQGLLDRGGLDKTGSNRGSPVWRVSSPRPALSASWWGSMTFVLNR